MIRFIGSRVAGHFGHRKVLVRRVTRRFHNRSRGVHLEISKHISNRRSSLVRSVLISRVVMFLITRHFSQHNVGNFSVPHLHRVSNRVNYSDLTYSHEDYRRRVVTDLRHVINLRLRFIGLR